MITGAQAMVKSLTLEGITTIFGYPGAAICPFYDALRDSSIRHILARTEQNAGHAASGYARMTGRPAVCVATSGPGATNLFTALATAYSDSIPLVAITGQVSSELLGRDVFQEVDTTGAAEPFTKYAYLVKHPSEIPRVIKEAFHIASTGRKGPVLLDIPFDVQQKSLSFMYPETVDIRGYKPRFQGHAVQVKRVAAAIRSAKRPLLCAGGGVFAADAQDAVRALCEAAQLPVVATMMGLGVLPSEHPLFCGMLGQSGSVLANRAVEESDLLILMGARAGDRALTAPDRMSTGKTVVHIDIDSAEIGKNLGTTIPLVGDARAVAQQLLDQDLAGDWQDWLHALQSRRTQPDETGSETRLHPAWLIRLLSGSLAEDAVYVADVGQNQIWSAANHIQREGRFLTSGGMGTMGYALPAAIGAKLADPTRQVVAVCGDGGFQMSLMELATANQHGAVVKLVVLNNRSLGMIRQIQRQSYGGREMAADLSGGPDICGIAAAYGIPAARLEHPADAPARIAQMLGESGSFVLECVIEGESR